MAASEIIDTTQAQPEKEPIPPYDENLKFQYENESLPSYVRLNAMQEHFRRKDPDNDIEYNLYMQDGVNAYAILQEFKADIRVAFQDLKLRRLDPKWEVVEDFIQKSAAFYARLDNKPEDYFEN